MRLARRPGVRLSPTALPAIPAPAAPRSGTCRRFRRRRGRAAPSPQRAFLPSPFPANDRASLRRRSRRTEQTLISTAGLRRDAGRPGSGQPRGAEPCRADPRSLPRTGGARTGEVPDGIPEGMLSRAHGARPQGRLWGGRSSTKDVPVTRGRLPGGKPVRGAAGRAAAAGGAAGRGLRSVPSRVAGPPSCRSRRVTSLTATTTRLSRKVVSPVPPFPPLSTATGVSD